MASTILSIAADVDGPSDRGTASVDDDERFRRLFADGYQPLIRYARRRTVDVSVADDVVAETFAIAWRRRADLRNDGPALHWLYGIAANVLRNQGRARTRSLRLVDKLQADPLTPASTDGGLELPDPALHEALERLSFDDREILRLATWEELAHSEIAEVLDCSVNAVGIRLHRARKRLRAELIDQREPSTPDADDNGGRSLR